MFFFEYRYTDPVAVFTRMNIWKVKTDNSLCIHLCFCMLPISFYFVNCVMISCELYYDNMFDAL